MTIPFVALKNLCCSGPQDKHILVWHLCTLTDKVKWTCIFPASVKYSEYMNYARTINIKTSWWFFLAFESMFLSIRLTSMNWTWSTFPFQLSILCQTAWFLFPSCLTKRTSKQVAATVSLISHQWSTLTKELHISRPEAGTHDKVHSHHTNIESREWRW